MSLSSDLINQFVKSTKDDKKTKTETITYGVVKEIRSDGLFLVQLDGASEGTLTPLPSTVAAQVGNRVIVMIKNHTATITGNTSSQSVVATNKSDIITIAHKISTDDISAFNGRIQNLLTKTANIDNAELINAEIESLNAKFAAMEYITAADAEIINSEIENLRSKFAEISDLEVGDLEAINADIDGLKAYVGDFTYISTDILDAIKAKINDLETNSLTVDNAKFKFANIDFTNIDAAAIESFFSKSGMITDLVVSEGTITGKLVGVTISGDLIEGNTVIAEKLVVKGSDGLYYKLNIEAGATTSTEVTEEDLQNGLHGTAIIAKTITAEKISVDDLVAFDATIGGFNITENAIYSGAKSSVDNTTRGTYLDDDGQVAFGDSSNYLKYYKDSEGNYKLVISASSIILSSSNKSIEDMATAQEADKAQTTANDANERAANAESLIAQLTNCISMLVTDGNGTSLMTQTEDGWTFSTADIQDSVNSISEALNTLTSDAGDTASAVDILEQAVEDLGVIAEYVKITTYEDEPCIELGEGDSDFKLRITNTRMMFTEGSTVLAYFNNQSLHIKNAVVEDELQQGGFVWKARSNGNLGLMWKGGSD